MATAEEEALAAAEDAVLREVKAALRAVARQAVQELGRADEITAAAWSVRRIAQLWREHVSAIMRRLFRSAAQPAVSSTADTAGDGRTPEGLDSLSDRYDDQTLPASLTNYATATEALVRAIGDRIAQGAARELSDGIAAGEDTQALRARLRAFLRADGEQLGEARAERIAATEATRAWNAGVQAAAEALTGPDRPLVKQWRTRGDARVRDTHRAVNGQLRLLDEAFTVGGALMQYPGDPSAPPDLTVNCRCVMRVEPAPSERTASMTDLAAATDNPNRGGMIALIPTAADAERLAVDGGHDATELHCTLYYLTGDASEWSEQQRAALTAAVQTRAAAIDGPVQARLFGINHWNPDSDDPAWVWATSDDRDTPGSGLDTAHTIAVDAALGTEGLPEPAVQHSPWVAHVTAGYRTDTALMQPMTERLGPVVFDRIRVVFAGDATDIPLTPGITAAGRAFTPGDRVVVTGKPHDEGSTTGTVAEVDPGPAYGIVLDGTDEIHRWYVGGELAPEEQEEPMHEPNDREMTAAPVFPVRTWSTPGDTALAFENEQTGDDRVFAPGSLYWEGDSWPIHYCDAMGYGHDGGELAGAATQLGRDGDRITGSGVFYMTQDAGWEVATLLDQDAPVGVSVDLDAVDLELISTAPLPDDAGVDVEPAIVASAHLHRASLMRLADGGWSLTASTAPQVTASGLSVASGTRQVTLVTDLNGRVSRDVAVLLAPSLTAAAGDPDPGADAEVLEVQRSGEFLMRVTRARVRGATLVTLPAYSRARVVIDPYEEPADAERAVAEDDFALAAAALDDYSRVVHVVWGRPDVLSSRDITEATGLPLLTVRAHLKTAVDKGHVARSGRRYTAPATLPEGSLVASVTGNTDLPIHEVRDAEWDGPAAASETLAWATGEDGEVDADKLADAFLWRDDEADPATLGAYKLGIARPVDGGLHIFPQGVFAVAAALQGARGGVDVPEADVPALRAKVETLYGRINETFPDDPPATVPWADEDDGDSEMDVLEASAWRAMQDLPPMPAEWFREPTTEELPPGSGGVHYKAGRIYGWVAQAGVPHASYGAKVTIEKIAAKGLDLSHFLRQKYALDDGTEVRAGAYTMDVGHHRDGYECETAACQLDDTRTVAGIVTVGMNEGGMWFSGAATPWVSEIDRRIMLTCQPSYHMTQGPGGQWQLRAVLSVPVPGHSSPLVASVVERSNMALAASAAFTAEQILQPEPEPVAEGMVTFDVEDITAALTTAFSDPALLDGLADALLRREAERAGEAAALRAEIDALAASVLPAQTTGGA